MLKGAGRTTTLRGLESQRGKPAKNGDRTMRSLKRAQNCCLAGALIFVWCSTAGAAQANPDPANTDSRQVGVQSDGQHDFDFEFGTWKTHLSRLDHPLTGSTSWISLEGVTVVRKVWDGRANLAELEADGPAGHLEVLSLRLYNPESRQWSLNAANSRGGALGEPTIGEFKNGRGEFFDRETFNGRTILVRNVWSAITPNSCRFEQSFSDDGGKTWEVNWIAIDTRLKDASDEER
jgi:hypothetical protein